MKSLLSQAKDCGTVIKWAVISRVCFLLLQVISHNLIPDHTGSMEDVFMKVHRDPHDLLTETTLGGFDNWDSEYFIFIAEHGYTHHDQTVAFFPLYPFLMRLLSNTLLYPLSFFITQRSILLCSGVILNFLVFPLATAALYLLTLEVSRNRKLAFLSSALFCINPASVFMSAVYTESFFFLFTLSGLLFLEYGRPWLAAVLFALGSATRSNGIVLCGFLAFQCLTFIIARLTGSKSVSVATTIHSVLKTLMSTFVQCLITLAPFALFQYYTYSIYCSPPSNQPPWCVEWDFLPPLPYSYVQQYYWNVGFLRYFQLKQLPNFLLAAPMVILSSYCIGKYIHCSVSMTTSGKRYLSICDQRNRLLPYIVHLGFLLVFGFFVINVQVLTRFICSSSPVIYWLSADVLLEALTDLKATVLLDPKIYSWREMSQGIIKLLFSKMFIHPPPKTSHRATIISRYLVGYFIVYVILGYVLHCNFYPWT